MSPASPERENPFTAALKANAPRKLFVAVTVTTIGGLLAAVLALVLSSCVPPGMGYGQLGMQANGSLGGYGQPIVPQANAFGASGGPVARAAASMNFGAGGPIVLPASAGQSPLRGSGFDGAALAGVYAQDAAERPALVTQTTGDVDTNGTPVAGPTGRTRAASGSRVSEIAARVSRHSILIESQRREIERLRQHQAAGSPAPTAAPATEAP